VGRVRVRDEDAEPDFLAGLAHLPGVFARRRAKTPEEKKAVLRVLLEAGHNPHAGK